MRRYEYWKNNPAYIKHRKILVSNIRTVPEDEEKEIIISYNKLVKCGWEHIDNSGLMALRLLDNFEVNSIGIVGFDGYSYSKKSNYASEDLELANVREYPTIINKEISSMLNDFFETRKQKSPIVFVTKSRFADLTENITPPQQHKYALKHILFEFNVAIDSIIEKVYKAVAA